MGAGRSRSNNSTVSAGHQVVTDDGASAMCCEVDDDFAAMMEPSARTVDGVGELVDDGFCAVQLVVAGQVVATLDPNEKVNRLRSCLGRGYQFDGMVTSQGIVRVRNG